MSRSNWFSSRRAPSSRRPVRRKPSTSVKRRKTRRFRLEPLEPRRVLAATVATDLLDYAPGATAHFFANEFAVGETVEFQVLHTDGVPNTGGGHLPWQVTDGVMGDFDGDGTMDGDLDGVADGNIHTTWYVNPDDSANSAFEVTAKGLSSRLTASQSFTDSVVFVGTPSVSSSSSSRSSATLMNHTVGAGTDRLLLVTVLTRGDEDVSSITFNGQALTQAVERDGGDDDETAVEIWYLKLGTSASATTANVVVNFSSNVDPSYIRVDNLTGVDQTTPIGATTGTIGDDDDVSVNITTTTANSLIYGAVAMFGGDTDPFETGSGLTQLFDTATGTSSSSDIGVWGAYRTAATTGSYNFSAEANNGDNYAVGVVEIRMTQAVAESPAINIVKRVNGNDANTAGTGPTLAAGGTATFTYTVTNIGNVALSNVSVVDDNGTPSNAGDNFSPTFTGGDTNSNGRLDLTETWTYSATRTVVVGAYASVASVSGKSPGNATVSDTDPANYFGSAPGLNIETAVNGQDADATTGPQLAAGGTATFTYVVTNTGNIAVGGISVVDNNGTPSNAGDDFSPTFQSGDTNGNNLLDTNETWTYTATRTIVVGQFTNSARASGSVAATSQSVSDTDATNYFGRTNPSFSSLSITSPINENSSATLSGTYSHDGAYTSHSLDIDWNGDGTYDQTVTVSGGSFSVNRTYLDDAPTATPSDTNNVNVRLRDAGGLSATRTTSITVNNVAPVIQALSLTSSVNEGGSATLSGTYTDVGTLDTHWLDIDWNGDGTYDQTLAVSGGSFSISNQFLDDNPTATASDTFNVNVRLRDDDNGADTESKSITVNNVAPVILSLSITSTILVGETATLSGTYSDVGTQDTHLLDIDWDGDGNFDDTIAVTSGTFAVTHTFASAGNFSVNARLRDDDGGSDTASTSIDVRKIPILVIAPDKGNTSKPIVKVLNQQTGKIISQFYAFEGKFLGGVQVTTGDMTGDGIDEIIVASGQGRVGEVRVFSQDGTELTQFRVQPYGTAYQGGIEVAVGDVDGDGDNDIVTVTKHGRPEVRVFHNNYNSAAPTADAIADTPSKQFFVYGTKFLGGADVVVADMGTFYNGVAYNAHTPDGRAEIIVGNGSGMVSTIHVYDVSAAPKIVDTILPFHNKFKGGITLSTARVNGDAIPDLIVAAGNGGGSAVEVWSGLTSDAYDVRLAAFTAFGDQATRNMPVHAAGLDIDGDGIADLLAVVQGTNGQSNQIRYFNMHGGLQGARYGLVGPWNIAALGNVDLSLPLNCQDDVAAKDDVYTQIGTPAKTTAVATKPAKKAKKKK